MSCLWGINEPSGSIPISTQQKHNTFYKKRKEEFGETKVIIRICISNKDRQNNGQTKKYKRTNNDLQNIHLKLRIEKHELH
jgi:hypothetical protein